ncbi:SGNH/GDSL hydrolase family protein [Arthrobacter sp. Cr_A7]|uniref:SGNH/GDSL hydrolase family protein n=1 Tax=Arthrobacter sp. Cr_A7 TaxID=3031017 RepID=UPI0023DB44D0|nr:SGNH/GDSL hydrolase family protein [Arthrobacter sp. Cr_A7]MDF2049380.1 SGNH/GDSL hydrolase family protein [Arthrobacter sp. Cr_A7]
MRKFAGRLATLAVAATAVVAGSVAAPAAAHESEPLDYVALGDSYTAGIGAGIVERSELYKDMECYQAKPPGYVDVLDGRPDVELAVNAACAGWTAAAVPVQVGVASAAGLNAGTDLVTITAGGNDVGFQRILEACLVPKSLEVCETEVEKGEATARTQVFPALSNAYASIRATAPNATIVALGYPHLFSPEFGDQPYITDEAAELFNKGTDTLNEVIEKAAKQVRGTVYADVTDEFEGHGIGSPASWIHLPGSAAGFHPTETGYAKGYYRAVVREAGIWALRH